jgi:hypothetical protein
VVGDDDDAGNYNNYDLVDQTPRLLVEVHALKSQAFAAGADVALISALCRRLRLDFSRRVRWRE